jgi:hypothetical protein
MDEILLEILYYQKSLRQGAALGVTESIHG